MIVINALIFGALLYIQPVQLSEVADAGTSRFPFLRRRTGSTVKKAELPAVMDRDKESISYLGSDDTRDSEVEEVTPPPRRFISFGLRQRAKSNDVPAPTFGSVISGLFSSLNLIKAIENLEEEYNRNEAKEDREAAAPQFTVPKTPDTAIMKIIMDRAQGKNFGSDDGESDGLDSEVGPGSSENASQNRSSSGSEYVDSKNPSSDALTELDWYVEGEDNLVLPEGPMTEIPQLKTSGSEDSLILPGAEPQRRSDFSTLSDSDAESWEKVERYMLDNVQVLAQSPPASQMIERTGQKQGIIDFLTIVFVKLARRIFFKPPPLLHRKVASYEDFVTDFMDAGEIEAEVAGKEYKWLDFDTANRILFLNDANEGNDDWCLLLPLEQDYQDALAILDTISSKELSQIDTDLPRLPQRYYQYYAERQGISPLECDKDELKEKIRLILAFCISCESKESTTSISDEFASSVFNKNQPITYTQGFDQIAAYFAINFDLDCAGPLAYRFFQLYLADLINLPTDKMSEVYRKTDLRAIRMVRAYLRDQIRSVILDFEIIFDMLEMYPFSNASASLLYFTSATTVTDLDRLVQFLLLRVPQDQAHKSISLLAAANMLYCMLALDELFAKELGSAEWAELKISINATSGTERHSILDSLVLRFMGDLYLSLNDKIVHSPLEFKDFIKMADSLVPYLREY